MSFEFKSKLPPSCGFVSSDIFASPPDVLIVENELFVKTFSESMKKIGATKDDVSNLIDNATTFRNKVSKSRIN